MSQKQEVLLNVFRQFWEHCRHMENMRLWFANIYGIMIGGILIYGSQAADPYDTCFTAAGGLFSLLGLIVAIRFYLEHEKYVENLQLVIQEIEGEFKVDLMKLYDGIIPSPELWHKWLGHRIVPTREWLRLRIIFIFFYTIMLGVSCALFALSFC